MRWPPPSTGRWAWSGDCLPECDSSVGHAVREAPFVVVPGHNAHKIALNDLGLVERESRGCRVVVEVNGNQRFGGIGQDALERSFGGRDERLVHFLRRCRLSDE